jgi:hypothetical protein
MELRAGQKLHSAVSEAQFVVVRAPSDPVEISCGGVPLLAQPVDNEARTGLASTPEAGALTGKRYADEQLGLELLCSRGGGGTLTVDDRALELKGAKPLPSSD